MPMISSILNLISGAFKLLPLILIYFKGKNDNELKNVEKENKKLKNRPRSINDIRNRLRDAIKNRK